MGHRINVGLTIIVEYGRLLGSTLQLGFVLCKSISFFSFIIDAKRLIVLALSTISLAYLSWVALIFLKLSGAALCGSGPLCFARDAIGISSSAPMLSSTIILDS